jgi:hypothetical protein
MPAYSCFSYFSWNGHYSSLLKHSFKDWLERGMYLAYNKYNCLDWASPPF